MRPNQLGNLNSKFIEFRTKRGAMIAFLIFSLLTAFFVWIFDANRTYYYDGIFGAKAVESSDLGDLNSGGGPTASYVQVTGNENLSTGLNEITERKRRKSNTVISSEVTAEYRVLTVGEKFLIVAAKPGNAESVTYTGEIRAIPAIVNEKFLSEVRSNSSELRDRFHPFMIAEVEYGMAPALWCGFMILLILLFGWSAHAQLNVYRFPELSQVAKQIGQYGALSDVSRAIESEVRSDLQVLASGWKMTRNWILSDSLLGISLYKTDKIAWVYQRVTKHSTNFIPTHKTYHVLFYNQFGEKFEVEVKGKKVEELLVQMQAKIPWAVFGFSEERAKAWDNNRAEFCSIVEERRSKLAG